MPRCPLGVVVQLIPHAPSVDAGPSFEDFGDLVDGRAPLGHRADAAVASDMVERAQLATTARTPLYQRQLRAIASCVAATRNLSE